MSDRAAAFVVCAVLFATDLVGQQLPQTTPCPPSGACASAAFLGTFPAIYGVAPPSWVTSASFADGYVITAGVPYTALSNYCNPCDTLGAPNFAGGGGPTTQQSGCYSLGNQGVLDLLFTNNTLTNSGDSEADLLVFEAGNEPEAFTVAVHPADALTITLLQTGGVAPDAQGFYPLNIPSTGPWYHQFDLDQIWPGRVAGTLRFDRVRVVDGPTCPGGLHCSGPLANEPYAGCDIDAVAALERTPPDPILTAIAPDHGPSFGGNTVTITGVNLVPSDVVKIGGLPLTNPQYPNWTTIVGGAPAGPIGPATVTIERNGIPAATTLTYTYCSGPVVTSVAPSSGPTLGGTTLTIHGQDFVNVTGVTVGGAAVPPGGITVVDASTIMAVTPAHPAGAADIVVTIACGASMPLTGAFTFVPPPAIQGIAPTCGSAFGTTQVVISGSDFGSASVTIGGVPASVVSSTTTQLVVDVPPSVPAGSVGARDVAVTTPYGAAILASGFTYLGLPIVSSVTIGTGCLPPGQATAFTVAGSGFSPQCTSVAVNGVTLPAAGLTITPTQITGNFSTSISGFVTVTVSNPGGLVTTFTTGTVVPSAGALVISQPLTITTATASMFDNLDILVRGS